MYSYTLTAQQIVFRTEWPNKQGFRETVAPRPSQASEQSLHLMCGEVLKLCRRGSRFSGTAWIEVAKRMFRYAEEQAQEFPSPGDPKWRKFIYEHFIYHLSNPEKRRGSGDKDELTVRSQWRRSVDFYKNLKQQMIVPYNILLPSMRLPDVLEDRDDSNILDSTEEQLWELVDSEELWPKIYLIDKDINVPTDKFLEKLQSQLETRSKGIIRACQMYWDYVVACQAIGAELINSIPIEVIEETIRSGEFYVNGRHLADPSNPDGAAWFLAVIDYYFMRTDKLQYVSYELMKEIPFLRPICNNAKIQTRMNERLREIAGGYGAPMARTNETLNRLLGHISARDCAAAAAILIAENPKFTPISLQEADYYSTTDVPIHHFNSELDRLMWSVSKPRATSRKVSPLPPASREMYCVLVRATSKARLRLMLDHNPNYRKLFLTSTFNWVGLCPHIDSIFTGPLGINLYTVLEKELSEAGVSKDSFSLKRIRGTQGLIAFLKEGTYQAVANTLGNSIAVVKNSYIPKWLMLRWNIRILRIFQTKLIVLATKGRPWRVEASDFTCEEDLFRFVVNAAREAETSDPISIDLKKYAAEITEDASNFLAKPLQTHNLLLKLSPLSLAATFLFAETYNAANTQSPEYIDERSGLSPESIITLSNLIHATYSYTTESSADNPIVRNISGISVQSFQQTYREALQIKAELSTKIISVRPHHHEVLNG
ncbi:hypothetical protein I8746_10575 [Pseudomonas sp. USTB-Z]|uniref:hypothetical protein n=1 Tax=Pseudomonas sp. USTB-Z TaxID=2794351 RepID=UPI001C82D1D7|nr:hypothetical protein [Pseudomonas sp. USTB-Z]MBX6690047.1 hypothetical protein [Pseudomonas sp. USTB-Z]